MRFLLLAFLFSGCVDGTPYEPIVWEVELEVECWVEVDGEDLPDTNCDGVPDEHET